MTNGTDAEWPRYDVGPRECMFALGVVGVKYSQLEFALSAMFSTVTQIGSSATSILLPKIRNNVRLNLMRESLPDREWPAEVVQRIQHFMEGFNICAANRNLLMHSNIFIMSKDAILLFKTRNSGKTVTCNPTLAEVRQVADDMNALFEYGLALSNTININLIPPKMTLSPVPWPDKPSSPRSLSYTGAPQTVRDMYQDR
jgi:hypothetical protein